MYIYMYLYLYICIYSCIESCARLVPVDGLFKLVFNNCRNHHKSYQKQSIKDFAAPYIPWHLIYNDLQKALTSVKL